MKAESSSGVHPDALKKQALQSSVHLYWWWELTVMSWPFHDCYWFLKSLCTSTGCCPAVSADQTVKHFNSKAKEPGSSLELHLDKLWGGESSCWSCFCFSCCLQGGIYPATLHRQLQLAIRLFFLSAAFKRGRTVNHLLCLLWIMLACCICVSVPHSDQGAQGGFIRQVMLLHLPFPVCTHAPVCSTPWGVHTREQLHPQRQGISQGSPAARAGKENPAHLPFRGMHSQWKGQPVRNLHSGDTIF